MAADVIWVTYHNNILSRGYWDQGILEDIFKQGDYQHFDGFVQWQEHGTKDGAVVIINGRTHYESEDIAKLNSDLSLLRWVVLIITGDEESLFDHLQVRHPLMRKWVQLPRVNKHNDVYRLPNGYRPDTRDWLLAHGAAQRDFDWFFAGQITHQRRFECAEVLRELPNGQLFETKIFGVDPMGLNYPGYLFAMRASKFVPCPSGPETPDSFRVWEALEAGCIPIVDAYSTNNPVPGFWEYLLGDDLPFPVVTQWTELPALMEELKRDYPRNANRVFAWWQNKKREMRTELERNVAVWS